jgi:hypothetical protein
LADASTLFKKKDGEKRDECRDAKKGGEGAHRECGRVLEGHRRRTKRKG